MNNLTPNSKIPYSKIKIEYPDLPTAIKPIEKPGTKTLKKISYSTPEEFDKACIDNEKLKPIYDVFNGMTILHGAAEVGNTSLVKHLITTYQANVNAGSSISGSPIFFAVYCTDEVKRLHTIKALISSGANINLGKRLLSYYGGTISPLSNLENVTVLREAPGIDLKLTLFFICHKAVANPPYQSNKKIAKSIKEGFEWQIPKKEQLLKENLDIAYEIYEKSMYSLHCLTNGSVKLPIELSQKVVSVIINLYELEYKTVKKA